MVARDGDLCRGDDVASWRAGDGVGGARHGDEVRRGVLIILCGARGRVGVVVGAPGDVDGNDVGCLRGVLDGLTCSTHAFKLVAFTDCLMSVPSSFCRRYTPRPSTSEMTKGPK